MIPNNVLCCCIETSSLLGVKNLCSGYCRPLLATYFKHAFLHVSRNTILGQIQYFPQTFPELT